MSDERREIELHDSEIAQLEHEGTTLVMKLEAYVHHSMGVPGRDAGTGWIHGAELRFDSGRFAGPAPMLPAEILGGTLRLDEQQLENMLPATLNFSGSVRLELDLGSFSKLVIEGAGLSVALTDEGSYMEDFPFASTTDEVSSPTSQELDAAHAKANDAFARRDADAYMELFHADLAYRQPDGQTVDRNRIEASVRRQLAIVHSAQSEFQRKGLVLTGEEAVEVLTQEATFEVRAFLFLHRAWTVRRRGRYFWTRTPGGWRITRVEVLSEVVLPTRTWLALR